MLCGPIKAFQKRPTKISLITRKEMDTPKKINKIVSTITKNDLWLWYQVKYFSGKNPKKDYTSDKYNPHRTMILYLLWFKLDQIHWGSLSYMCNRDPQVAKYMDQIIINIWRSLHPIDWYGFIRNVGETRCLRYIRFIKWNDIDVDNLVISDQLKTRIKEFKLRKGIRS